MGKERGEEMMRGAGCAPVIIPCGFLFRPGARGVIPSPSVAPEGTSMERLYSPWRGLFHPDMMCLTKAGKEDKKLCVVLLAP